MRYLVAVILCLMMGIGFGQAPVVGDYYGGGVVFWVNPDDSNQGLVCDVVDLAQTAWGCENQSGFGTALEIGSGADNTIAIINNCNNIYQTAAEYCYLSDNLGFTDWYLPSQAELLEMCLNQDLINESAINNGGDEFQLSHYWSSSEGENDWSWHVYFDNCASNDTPRYQAFHVRAVRSYSFVPTPGCTDPTASNYDPEATEDDGSCCYEDEEWVQIGQTIIGEALSDFSGWNVSLNNDGNILAVSAPYNDGGSAEAGHVRVYENVNGDWNQLGQDLNGDQYNDWFGDVVSLNASGNRIAIGTGYADNGNEYNNNAGHVKIFEYNGVSWIQLGNDIQGDAASDNFSQGLSLSADGSIIAIGAPQSGSNSGYVKAYYWDGSSWNQIGATLYGEEEQVGGSYIHHFGSKVSLSEDGNVLAIGAPGVSGYNYGYVKAFNWTGNSTEGYTWSQIGQTINGELLNMPIGNEISLSNNGNVLAIKFPSESVRIYQLDNGLWTQLGADISDSGSGTSGSESTISLNHDGTIIAIGDPWATDLDNINTGQVRIYKYDDVNWGQIGNTLYGNLSSSTFGRTVSLSSSGNIIAIGAPDYPYPLVTEGGAYVYLLPSCSTPDCTLEQACNYNPDATEDDGSCLFVSESCDDGDESTLNDTIQEDCSCSGEALCVASECCISGTQWDLNTMTCVYEDACSADTTKDGFVAVDDLLELLSAFGNSCEEVSTGIGGEECVGAECCGENTIWCETLEICIPFISCPADLNEDESIGVDDLLTFLISYGEGCEEYEFLPDCEVTLDFSPEVSITLSNVLEESLTSITYSMSQDNNESEIFSSLVASDGGSFNLDGLVVGNTIGIGALHLELYAGDYDIESDLIVQNINNSDYLIFNYVTYSTSPDYSVGDIAGGFVISNTASGIIISTEIPEDEDDITEAYSMSLTFTDLFTTPSSGNLTFTSTLTSELGDVDVQEFDFEIISPPWMCGDLIEHDGYEYSTVQIGQISEQCWFSENCRYLPVVSPPSESSETSPYYYVYGYYGTDVQSAKATSNYATYGVLYNWHAVMTDSICPSGWGIPSDADWMTLEVSLGMSQSDAQSIGWRDADVGYQMKSISGWNDDLNGSNSSGFNGLASGFRVDYSGFVYIGASGYWWSSSELESNAWIRMLVDHRDHVYRNLTNSTYGFSARCIKD